MAIWSQDKFIIAWNFASNKHNGQIVPGTAIPYINHLGNVAMEVMSAIAANPILQKPDLAVQCALLHDIIEDACVPYQDLVTHFGSDVADGVQALSKNPDLPKDQQMNDSLHRIRQQPIEVWMVKLADRITNLQPPPSHWSREKISAYRDEALKIHTALFTANESLANRLKQKIETYGQYC